MNREFFHTMRNQMQPEISVQTQLYSKIELMKKPKIRKITPKYEKIAAACLTLFLIIGIVPKLINDTVRKDSDLNQSLATAEFAVGKSGTNTPDFQNDVPTVGAADSKTADANAQTEISEIYVMPNWDDMTNDQKYSQVTLHNTIYDSITNKIADVSQIGRFVEDIVVKGYDEIHQKNYTINCSVYALKSVSEKCAIAVKFEDSEDYYSYVNSYYTPATLGEFINDLNLRENLVFNTIYHSYTDTDNNYVSMQYTLPDTSVIWNFLLSDPSAANSGDAHYSVSAMDIAIDVKTIGHKNISLAVTEDGYLQTNILNTAKTFYIGKEKVKAFKEYVVANGMGTINYVTPRQPPDTVPGGIAGSTAASPPYYGTDSGFPE